MCPLHNGHGHRCSAERSQCARCLLRLGSRCFLSLFSYWLSPITHHRAKTPDTCLSSHPAVRTWSHASSGQWEKSAGDFWVRFFMQMKRKGWEKPHPLDTILRGWDSYNDHSRYRRLQTLLSLSHKTCPGTACLWLSWYVKKHKPLLFSQVFPHIVLSAAGGIWHNCIPIMFNSFKGVWHQFSRKVSSFYSTRLFSYHKVTPFLNSYMSLYHLPPLPHTPHELWYLYRDWVWTIAQAE